MDGLIGIAFGAVLITVFALAASQLDPKRVAERRERNDDSADVPPER